MEDLLSKLQEVEKRANTNKFARFLFSPLRYLNAILFRELRYKNHKQSKSALTDTFFGDSMRIELPAATDIYLTGGKTHDSEIRLARYLIKNLKAGDQFVDVGAHYGYFSLLAAQLVGEKGQVHAFEAARSNFHLLEQNAKGKGNVQIQNKAISSEQGQLTFYEFPAMYSEYNSMTIEQYKNEDWFRHYPPTEYIVQAILLSDYILEKDLRPSTIKIDVEGAEDKVIHGLQRYLRDHSPRIIMEYLSPQRHNENHRKAASYLGNWGFEAYRINSNGQTTHLPNIDNHFLIAGIDSDNLVFKKSND